VDEFLKAIHDAVLDAGAKDLARKMGCSHVALLQRANPNTLDHRLNVEQLFQILVHSGDMRPLKVLAGEFGFDLAARADAPRKALVGALMDMAAEAGDVTRAVHDAVEDGRVSSFEKSAIRKEIAEVRKAMDVLEESVKVA
jgi:hypothetical protein